MIKKIHYIQLVLLILLLFFLFQFTSISISFNSSGSDYNYVQTNTAGYNYRIASGSPEVLLISGDNGAVAACLEQELTYMKKSYRIEKSLVSYQKEELNNTKILILCSDKMADAYNLQLVQEYMKKGINVIMAGMPSDGLDQNWRSFLGISELGNLFKQKGITVFSGFFLGGEQKYKSLNFDTYRLNVSSTCKTYIAGIPEKSEQQKPQGPFQDMLWRNVYDRSQIFVVNGSFFKDNDSIGILSGIFSQIYKDFLYPVINAKVFLVNNSPSLVLENEEKMQSRYARNSKRFFEDIVLPDIVALSLSTENVPTFFAVSSIDYRLKGKQNYDTSVLPALQQELQKIGGEIGVSAYDLRDSRPEDKVLNDVKLFTDYLKDYSFQAINLVNYDKVYQPELLTKVNRISNVSSIITEGDKSTNFSMFNKSVVNIPVVSKGFSENDRELFKFHNAATALGVISHEIDMKEIIYAADNAADWTSASVNLTGLVGTYWRNFKVLDSTNITKAGKRVHRFLEMRPEIQVKDDRIKVLINNFDGEAYFILRSDKSIAAISNGKFKKLEDNAYLICSLSPEFELTLK